MQHKRTIVIAYRTMLSLLSFPLGANQLLWYYADLEKQRCYQTQDDKPGGGVLGAAAANMSTAASAASAASAAANEVTNTTYGADDIIQHDINHCLAWRRFAK